MLYGVKSEAKHYKYKKPGSPFKIYPNLLPAELKIDKPLQCVVSYCKPRTVSTEQREWARQMVTAKKKAKGI